jgi:hypothetical protein
METMKGQAEAKREQSQSWCSKNNLRFTRKDAGKKLEEAPEA